MLSGLGLSDAGPCLRRRRWFDRHKLRVHVGCGRLGRLDGQPGCAGAFGRKSTTKVGSQSLRSNTPHVVVPVAGTGFSHGTGPAVRGVFRESKEIGLQASAEAAHGRA
jgi:hypothetical protein